MDYQKLLAALFALIFVVFALLQHNDPDAQIWVSVYSAAALGSFLSALDRLPRHLHLWFAGVALLGALALTPGLMTEIERVRQAHLNASNPLLKSTATMEYEVLKEIGGLAIVGLGFALLYVLKRRTTAPRREA